MRPGWTRRYVLSSSRSPITTEVFACSRPNAASSAPWSSAAESSHATPNPGEGRQTSAAIGRTRLAFARQGADGHALRDGGSKGAPGPVARDCLPHHTVANHHRDGVATHAPMRLVCGHVHEGQRDIGRESEGMGQAGNHGCSARGRVPAAGANCGEVEARDRRRDSRSIDQGQTSVLIVKCSMAV